jgi:hypothetical protein
MSRDLANARLVPVNGYGHRGLGNPSSCARTIEGDYFVNGTLPPPGTVCQQDKAPYAS